MNGKLEGAKLREGGEWGAECAAGFAFIVGTTRGYAFMYTVTLDLVSIKYKNP